MLQELKGSEKQIKWANEIRAEYVDQLNQLDQLIAKNEEPSFEENKPERIIAYGVEQLAWANMTYEQKTQVKAQLGMFETLTGVITKKIAPQGVQNRELKLDKFFSKKMHNRLSADDVAGHWISARGINSNGKTVSLSEMD